MIKWTVIAAGRTGKAACERIRRPRTRRSQRFADNRVLPAKRAALFEPYGIEPPSRIGKTVAEA